MVNTAQAPLDTEADGEGPLVGHFTPDVPGVVSALGELAPTALITEEGLARIFGRSHDSIKRAVERNELPPSVRMFGKPTWTVEAINRHMQDRLADARGRALEDRERILRHAP